MGSVRRAAGRGREGTYESLGAKSSRRTNCPPNAQGRIGPRKRPCANGDVVPASSGFESQLLRRFSRQALLFGTKMARLSGGHARVWPGMREIKTVGWPRSLDPAGCSRVVGQIPQKGTASRLLETTRGLGGPEGGL